MRAGRGGAAGAAAPPGGRSSNDMKIKLYGYLFIYLIFYSCFQLF